ncbi:MAG: hypothetical protein ACYC6Y_08300 [Thermoguttaceae bacterium]
MAFVACTCGKKFRATDALAGKQIACPGCGRPLLIPAATLLDEELDRPAALAPLDATSARKTSGSHSTAVQAWLLLVLLACGVAVLVAVGTVFYSMFSGAHDAAGSSDAAANTPAPGAATASPAAPPASTDTGSAGKAAAATPSSPPKPAASSAAGFSPGQPAAADADAPPPRQSVQASSASLAEPVPDRTPSSSAGSVPPAGSSDRPAEETIRLSAGTALPQSLPTGTAMGFSVDYQFQASPPSGAVNLAWVIEGGKGQVLKQPVQMATQGTLQGFVPELRPEDGPFSTHIEDPSGRRLSRSVSLR